MTAARNTSISFTIPACIALVMFYRPFNSLSFQDPGINTPANFPDPAFRRAVEHFMRVRPGATITISQAAGMTGYLDCDNRNIRSVEGLHFFTNIRGFWCAHNEIEQLDLSRNHMLQQVHCSHNRLVDIRLPTSESLREIHCYNNQLTHLNMASCESLHSLRCDFNQLTSLDLSSNPNLRLVGCSNNQLSELNLFWNGKLQILFCGNNRLAALDLSHIPGLTVLRCLGNDLQKLLLPNPSRIEMIDWSLKNVIKTHELLTLNIANDLEGNGAG